MTSPYLTKQVLTPGQTFGKYEIVKMLGKGGMGEVYLAKDSFLDREVAIKVLPLKVTTDPLFRERMQREAAAGARVEHPHLVRIYDGGVTPDDVVFVVMEFLGQHKTLRELIHSSAPFAYAQWIRIGISIADGLMACHAASIVHRDLKPENVVLLPGGHVKIIDFGLAKIRSSAIRTTMGNALGKNRVLATPHYASPEQLGGPSKDIDEKADIWALGCILYEMALGRQLWQTTTQGLPSAQAATWAVQTKEPPKIADSRLSLPAGLAELIDRCLRRTPSERPTALDMARGLRQYLGWKVEILSTDPISSGFQPLTPSPGQPTEETPAERGPLEELATVPTFATEDPALQEPPTEKPATKEPTTEPDAVKNEAESQVSASVESFDSEGTRFGHGVGSNGPSKANNPVEPKVVLALEVSKPAEPAPLALAPVPPRAAGPTLQSALGPVESPAASPLASSPAAPAVSTPGGGFRAVPRTIQMATVERARPPLASRPEGASTGPTPGRVTPIAATMPVEPTAPPSVVPRRTIGPVAGIAIGGAIAMVILAIAAVFLAHRQVEPAASPIKLPDVVPSERKPIESVPSNSETPAPGATAVSAASSPATPTLAPPHPSPATPSPRPTSPPRRFSPTAP